MRERPDDAKWRGASTSPGVRSRQAEALLKHWEGTRRRSADSGAHEDAFSDAVTIILADFNQPLRYHCSEEEWQVIGAGLSSPSVAQPLEDGVAPTLNRRGFRCAYELCDGRHNFGPDRHSPPMTHWTGTTVDFAYVHGASDQAWHVGASYVRSSPLSDHLPVVVDLVRSRSPTARFSWSVVISPYVSVVTVMPDTQRQEASRLDCKCDLGVAGV